MRLLFIIVVFAIFLLADTKYTNRLFYGENACGPQRELRFRTYGVSTDGSYERLQPDFLGISPTRQCNKQGRKLWILNESYSYCYEPEGKPHEMITVPANFVTDLTSIPAIGRIFYDPTDFPEAALVHDYLYAVGLKKDPEDTRKKADDVFRAVAEETGNSWRRRNILHFAVSRFGQSGYGLESDHAFWDVDTRKIRIDPKPYSYEIYSKVLSCKNVFIEDER